MARKSNADRARRKQEKEKRRRKRQADRERQAKTRAGADVATEEAAPEAPAARRPRPGGGKRPDLGPAGALVDAASFGQRLLDQEQSNLMIDRLVGLLQTEEGLASLRFDALALREADEKAKIDELQLEDDAERQSEALRRVIPLLIDERFRRRTRQALDLAAGALVASIAKDRRERAEALALGVLLVQGRSGEDVAANPLWRAITVLSYQEAGALQEYAHKVRAEAEGGEASEPGESAAPADAAAAGEAAADAAKAGLPAGSLDRAIGRVYRDRFEGAQEAARRGELRPWPLYRLLHLCRAYGRGLRRASVASQFGVPPDRFYEWLGDKITECAPKDLDTEFLGREAAALLAEARTATDAGDAARAKRLLDAHGFLEGAASDQIEVGQNPLVRYHYFESLQRLLGEGESARAEASAAEDEASDAPKTEGDHARAIVGSPEADDAFRAYAAALRERGEAEAADRVESFVAAEKTSRG